MAIDIEHEAYLFETSHGPSLLPQGQLAGTSSDMETPPLYIPAPVGYATATPTIETTDQDLQESRLSETQSATEHATSQMGKGPLESIRPSEPYQLYWCRDETEEGKVDRHQLHKGKPLEIPTWVDTAGRNIIIKVPRMPSISEQEFEPVDPANFESDTNPVNHMHRLPEMNKGPIPRHFIKLRKGDGKLPTSGSGAALRCFKSKLPWTVRRVGGRGILMVDRGGMQKGTFRTSGYGGKQAVAGAAHN